MTALSEALKCIVDSNEATVQAAGVSDSSVYRWISDECPPSFDAIRQMVRHLYSNKAKLLLVSALIGSLPVHVVWMGDTEDLDIDGDGKVSADDAMRAMVDALTSMAKVIKDVQDAKRDNVVSYAELAEIQSAINSTIEHLATGAHCLARTTERTERRPQRRIRLATN